MRSKTRVIALTLLILLTAIYARTLLIQSESLEGDELFSRRLALASPNVALHLIQDDLVHPPLYYFALKSILPATGAGALGIRTLSLVCGIASIGVVLLWGFATPILMRACFLASCLLVFNSVDIFYSQQARSYSLYSCCIALLILWALVLDRYAARRWYWIVGTTIMILTVYTHYVGALFVAAIFLATMLSRAVPTGQKLRMAMASGIAALSFLPWIFSEIAVYKSKHGLGNNLSWQGAPTGYDLRSIWGDYIGMPPIHGGALLAFGIGLLLAGLALARGLRNRIGGLLLATAALPPLVLYGTSFKPLNMTVFGERHLLPCIFATLVLVAFGLNELASLTPRPKLVWACGEIFLCSLQWIPFSRLFVGPSREPYELIASDLKTNTDRREPVYTTWPYGIGETVNFYLENDRVQPLPAIPPGAASLPNQFVVLYRPAVSSEQNDLNSFMQKWPGASMDHCHYYSAAGSPFGTRLCTVSLRQ